MVSKMTPIQQAIKIIIEVLRSIAQDTIPPDHIGVTCPLSEGDLPTTVISAKDLKEIDPGIGNFIGFQKNEAKRFSEIKSSKIRGTFQIKIWGQSIASTDEITTAVIETIETKKMDLKKGGFMYLSLNSFGEIIPAKLPIDPPKVAMVRLIEYQGIFELINIETFGPEGIIREVHVHIDSEFDENIGSGFDENMIIKEQEKNS
jgi:hypothetical protein